MMAQFEIDGLPNFIAWWWFSMAIAVNVITRWYVYWKIPSTPLAKIHPYRIAGEDSPKHKPRTICWGCHLTGWVWPHDILIFHGCPQWFLMWKIMFFLLKSLSLASQKNMGPKRRGWAHPLSFCSKSRSNLGIELDEPSIIATDQRNKTRGFKYV
jgi:hypothetical protein